MKINYISLFNNVTRLKILLDLENECLLVLFASSDPADAFASIFGHHIIFFLSWSCWNPDFHLRLRSNDRL